MRNRIRSSKVHPLDAPDDAPMPQILGLPSASPSLPIPITLFDLPAISMRIVLDCLKQSEKKSLRLVSHPARSFVDCLGVQKVEVVDLWTFRLASKFKSLLSLDYNTSSDEDLIKITALAVSLPLLHTLHIRTSETAIRGKVDWKRLIGKQSAPVSLKYQPSPSALISLLRSLDYSRRKVEQVPSHINIVCHFPVGLTILSALNLQSNSCLSISLTETIMISSLVLLSSHRILTEVKIDCPLPIAALAFAPGAPPMLWPPRLKKLDIGFSHILPPDPSRAGLTIGGASVAGLALRLETLVVRGDVALMPCFFEHLGKLVQLSSLTLWVKSWIEIGLLASLSLLPALTSLQVARIGLGSDERPCLLQSVSHLNYYLLDGGSGVLSTVFPNVSHATLRDFPLSSSPGYLSGMNLTHLSLMQHSSCPPAGNDPAAVDFNVQAVHLHFQALSSICGIKVLSFKTITQGSHISTLFDLIRTNRFPALRTLSLMAKEKSDFISSPAVTLSPINQLHPILISDISIDAGLTAWPGHLILTGCSLPCLKSLKITRQTAPISMNSILTIIQGMGSLQSLELPAAFSFKSAVKLKRLLREMSIDPQVSIEVQGLAPVEKKKGLGAVMMSCLAPPTGVPSV